MTGALLRSRFRVAAGRLEPIPFHVPVTHNGFRFRLLPAGHIPGSAMLHITRISDNATLLYTGDFKTRRSRTTEQVSFLSADTLVMETTFGLPGYEFPNPMEVDGSILQFIHDSFADGETPVLLGYSLGKAQEAAALLAEHGIPVLLHPTAAEMTRACIEAGVEGLPEPVEFDGHAPPGHVLIAPPHAVRTHLLKGLKSKRTAMLSGWALQPGARFRYRVDAMLPLSDHADHPGLLECVQRVKPRRVLTVHGFAREFAAELRTRGMEAWCASGGDQLELAIHNPTRRHTAARAWHKRVVCRFADFSDLCKLVSETGSRVAKTKFLANYLGSLNPDEDLKTSVRWLATADGSKAARKARLDPATLKHALLSLPGAREERYREIHQSTRDVVRSTRLFLQELPSQPEAADLAGMAAFIDGFLQSTASLNRTASLAARIATLHPAESETLVRILSGDLRLGAGLNLIEEAIAIAFKADVDEIRRVAELTRDLPETAVLARHGNLASATPRTQETATPGITPSGSGEADLPFPPI